LETSEHVVSHGNLLIPVDPAEFSLDDEHYDAFIAVFAAKIGAAEHKTAEGS